MFPKESPATRSSREQLSHPWLPKQLTGALSAGAMLNLYHVTDLRHGRDTTSTASRA